MRQTEQTPFTTTLLDNDQSFRETVRVGFGSDTPSSTEQINEQATLCPAISKNEVTLGVTELLQTTKYQDCLPVAELTDLDCQAIQLLARYNYPQLGLPSLTRHETRWLQYHGYLYGDCPCVIGLTAYVDVYRKLYLSRLQ